MLQHPRTSIKIIKSQYKNYIIEHLHKRQHTRSQIIFLQTKVLIPSTNTFSVPYDDYLWPVFCRSFLVSQMSFARLTMTNRPLSQMETDSFSGLLGKKLPELWGVMAMSKKEIRNQITANRNHLRKIVSQTKKRTGDISRKAIEKMKSGSKKTILKLSSKHSLLP